MRFHVYTTYAHCSAGFIEILLEYKRSSSSSWKIRLCRVRRRTLLLFGSFSQSVLRKGPHVTQTQNFVRHPQLTTLHQEHYHLWNKTSTIGHRGGRVTTKGVLAWTRRANQRRKQRMSHRTKRHQDHRRGREREEHLHRSVTESCKSSGKNASRDITNRSRKGEPVAHSENNNRNRNKKGKAFRFTHRHSSLPSQHPQNQRKWETEEQAMLVCKSRRGQAFSRHARQSQELCFALLMFQARGYNLQRQEINIDKNRKRSRLESKPIVLQLWIYSWRRN